MDTHGWGPPGTTDDEVCVSDDKLLGDEIVSIDSDHGGTRLGEITNVEGGKLDAVETEKASQGSAITDSTFICGIFVVVWRGQSRRRMEGTWGSTIWNLSRAF